MKILLIVFALLIPAVSQAASPEENYIAARDRAIKTLTAARKRGMPDKELMAQHTRSLAELETQLRRVVGASALKGFSQPGKINLEGLIDGDGDFGNLDGLLYTSTNNKTRIVTTTQTLLKDWLRVHSKWHEKGENVPQGMAPALRTGMFYTQALGGGAAYGIFAELPVGSDAGFTTAVLVARAQDIGSRNPRELVVASVRGPRVFIVSTEASAEIAKMPKCEAIWDDVKKKSEAAFEAYRESELKDKAIMDRQFKLEEESDAEYTRCFADGARADPNFKTLVAQAQAIVDGLPAK
jgi:hypothetical protein